MYNLFRNSVKYKLPVKMPEGKNKNQKEKKRRKIRANSKNISLDSL